MVAVNTAVKNFVMDLPIDRPEFCIPGTQPFAAMNSIRQIANPV